jgi:hypothetical protein
LYFVPTVTKLSVSFVPFFVRRFSAANLPHQLGTWPWTKTVFSLMGSIWHVDRKFAFNVTVRWFWRYSI